MQLHPPVGLLFRASLCMIRTSILRSIMKLKTLVAFVAAGLLSASAFAADATVKLTDVHLCCQNCVNGVNTALRPMGDTVKAACTRDQATGMGTVAITAPDTATAQKRLIR